MAELTEDEAKWVKRVQRALAACPSPDVGFYTTGDPDVSLYRIPEDGDIEQGAKQDFSTAVDEHDAYLGSLNFPNQVHSTAG